MTPVLTEDQLRRKFDDLSFPEPNSGCWIWMGAVWPMAGQGLRGNISICSVRRAAYRVAYELFRGPIPAGLFVCHKCDTPICVNPDHLFVGTNADNMRDKHNKGRHRSGKAYNRGEANPRAKLTAEQAAYIHASDEPAADLAQRFPVARRTIRDIQRERIWRTAV